ncbi:MAG: molybdopterin-dependent oxidoreductase [Chloroflexota bacterium]|nr:molybdopterin-dependent oxidoreductase [Chloroflexota bacterium]
MIAAMKKAYIPGGFGAGVGAAIAMMLLMAVLRFTTNTPSVPELMEESLIRLTGGQIESYFINLLGVGGKALLLVSIVEGTLLLGGLLGLGFTHTWLRIARMRGSKRLSGLVYGLVIGFLLNAVFLPLVDQGFFGSNALQVTAPPDIALSLYGRSLAPIGVPVFLEMFILTAVFGLVLVALLPWPRTAGISDAKGSVDNATGAMPRRDFVKALGGGGAALLGGVALWYGIRRALEPPPVAGLQDVDLGAGGQAGVSATPGEVHNVETGPTAGMADAQPTPPIPPGFEGIKPKLVPEITPVESFYITTKNFVDPTVDGNSWTLTFKGMSDNPFSLTLKELQALPAVNRLETLACISNGVGGSLIGNAVWKGVSFSDLLVRAKPQKGVVDVVVRGADGYADSFPLDVALKNSCVLVYEMDGKPLTQKHGYPARLLVPNIYGMKNCKWITEVEFVNNDFKGYWESQGWDDVAHYQTMSRIDYPDADNIAAKPIFIGGIAFAGNRHIKAVEVSTDDGKSWNPAELRPEAGPFTWRQWIYPWKPTAGTYRLKVRATDGTGAVQTATEANTFPNGATGYHTKQVRVG